ncbi:MAG: phosphoglycerate dehydrogenase [Rhodospirillales bacterium]
MPLLSPPKDELKILLLEGIHANAVDQFKNDGFANVVTHAKALDAADLKEAIRDAHVIGIRSRTKLTEDILSAAESLVAIGCFCIGTNQVNLDAARTMGIPVFNAPYSNTRSVAELVLAEAIMLMRGVPEKSKLAHDGVWLKSADQSHEIRGKVLGIVGYGHIGSQLSIMAESLGMQVRYRDIETKLSMGNATPVSSLDELLESSDVVSLHVPSTPETKGMIGEAEIRRMKPGSHLINASRGDVVDLEALARALGDGHIRGAAVDVFPKEPASAQEALQTPLRGFGNVILTPHVGGSTQEAQENIGTEVAEKLIRYMDHGATVGAVNFIEAALPVRGGRTRFVHVHKNVPGVLSRINEVFSDRGMNIAGQYLQTDGQLGFAVVDIDTDEPLEAGLGIRRDLQDIEGTIRVRFLY